MPIRHHCEITISLIESRWCWTRTLSRQMNIKMNETWKEIPDELAGPKSGHPLEPALIKTGGGQVEAGHVKQIQRRPEEI